MRTPDRLNPAGAEAAAFVAPRQEATPAAALIRPETTAVAPATESTLIEFTNQDRLRILRDARTATSARGARGGYGAKFGK